MLGDDALVLHRHLPPRERHHARTCPDVALVQRRSAQGGAHARDNTAAERRLHSARSDAARIVLEDRPMSLRPRARRTIDDHQPEGALVSDARTDEATRRPRSWPGGIAAITVFVEDLEAAKRFYADVFRLPVHYEDRRLGRVPVRRDAAQPARRPGGTVSRRAGPRLPHPTRASATSSRSPSTTSTRPARRSRPVASSC